MKLDLNGVSMVTLQEYLAEKIDKVKSKLGSDFYIRPEGVIDNIIVALTFMEYFLLEQIMFLLKQFDPETAEREYQDNLYERVGIYRIKSTHTSFKKNILGIPNTVIPVNSVTIRQKISGEEFTNAERVAINSSGEGEMLFNAVIEGNILVSPQDSFDVIESTEDFINLSEESAFDIVMGTEDETDSEFRNRFHNIKNNRAKCSRNAIIKNLSEYVEFPQYLNVTDRNTDNSINAGYILIIAKPIVSDLDFAKAILDNVLGGIRFLGDTTVSVPMSNGLSWQVKFQKAVDVEFNINAVVKIKQGHYQNNVFSNIRTQIMIYIQKRAYGLGSRIYATEFIVPILEADGVEAVTSVDIKKNTDLIYSDDIELARDEVPVFDDNGIFLSQE